jgi:serine/threonine-protein phosphatase CPPED1
VHKTTNFEYGLIQTETMKTRRLIIVLALFLIVAGGAAGQNKKSFRPFFFIQITDPQFGMNESDKGFAIETELYTRAVESINKLHPKFVVITGDLVNNRKNTSQLSEFKRITAMIDPKIHVWYSPGNHDVGQVPTRETIDSFISDYGHDRFSFFYRNNLFVGLNSSVIKNKMPGLEENQFDWLKKELSETNWVSHKVIFCHYPFFISDPEESEVYSNISMETRKKYLELFKETGVDAIFAGHLHKNTSAKYGTIEMTATSSAGKPHSEAPPGFRVVIVRPGRLESTYYGLGEVPSRIRIKGK